MDQVSRGWLIYELTDSTVQLGLVRGVQAIPILLLSPIAGSAADRYSRKNADLGRSDHRWRDVRAACDPYFHRTNSTLARVCDGIRHGLCADLSAAGAGGDHRRRGADGGSHQRHRSQLDHLQRGPKHRAGVGRRAHRRVWHRRRFWHSGRVLHPGDLLDAALAHASGFGRAVAAATATASPSRGASSKVGSSVGATSRCAPRCSW